VQPCFGARSLQECAEMTTAAFEAPPTVGPCWVCGSTKSTPYKPRSLTRKLVAGDLKISDSNYGCTLAISRCQQCGFLFSAGADLSELFALYEALDDPGYEESQDCRALQMNWLLDAASRYQPTIRSVLDVGAATGLLVSLARARGWHAEGVEPSQSLVSTALRMHGVRLLQGALPHPQLLGQRFDAVFLVDVIEHVSDPVALLRQATRMLEPGGVLIVVTPDVASIARRLLGHRWWHFRLAHVGYFDSASFEQACRQVQLQVLSRFRAQWFFRVSYLAERLARYLPIRSVVRLLATTRAGKTLADQVVPLNLHDSWVFVCKEAAREN
jgi:2-polyprenyl-3-methyl-5-hydroxy-6-metoxy-1,4-benzoquinol methylase